ncbi:DUF4386 domain-containing protein [Dyella jiangningensis]|uniref:DUF4386 domain-containing protein n=1 Tax=Dyella jiangningensis TaxID=1379159 RepID=A0A328P980_9GAMM|nr:DUF4386 domain-containing protein [Dyella jiangningensis]RAO78170.1 hypothetical protein CA260_10215 [Dyella jiangningensis]
MTTIETSPQLYARSAGLLYLLIIVFGGFAEGFVMNSLVVAGDAAATAHNILASPGLWNLSVAGNLLVPVLAVAQTWIFYLLLRPVNRQLVLLSVFLMLVSLSVEAVSKLFLLAVMPILTGGHHPGAFEPLQAPALAHLSLVLHDIAFNIALIFFGLGCLVDGYLIIKSRYLPKLIGLLMQLAGLSYLIACFAALLAPTFADSITPAILLPALIGETSFCLWLLIKGVHVAKWKERIGTEHANETCAPIRA